MCIEGLILRQSLKGTILQPATRRHVNTLLYFHFAITCGDVFFTILGTLLDYHVGNSCYVRNHVHTAIVVVIVGNYFIIACNFLGVALIFSVFSHLPSEEKWDRLFGILGCCLCMPTGREREVDNQGTLSQIAICFGEVFQGADLVPSDIAAGLALLALQHRGILEGEPLGCEATEGGHGGTNNTKDQRMGAGTSGQGKQTVEKQSEDVLTAPLLGEEGSMVVNASGLNMNDEISASHEAMSPEELSDMLAEAAHYARWALASYGWMLYTWANPSGGLAMACSCQGLRQCCCCGAGMHHEGFGGSGRIKSGSPDSLDRAALKTCAGIRGEDLFYVSFTNGVGEQPYFIARDTARRAIVLSVRGTMSVQDCITDSMYKPVLLNADAIGMPHLSGSQLHCHAGVVTATNFILSDLERHKVLHQILLGERPPQRADGDGIDADYNLDWDSTRGHEGWTLVLCGHSLGAGVATVLSLHLRQMFPSVRVWGIEPPGGLLSAELACACREWTVSTLHGCDLITRLSGPCLLKLRKDLVDALVRCKVNKFSLLARMTCASGYVEEGEFLLPPGQGAHEATLLRQEFEQFHAKQVSERPLMAAALYPPGKLLHLRRLPAGQRRPNSLAESYEARWVGAQELMSQGILINSNFFTDHFPDKVVAVLSELAMKYSAASSHYSFSSSAIGAGGVGGRTRDGREGGNGTRHNLMESLVHDQRADRSQT